MIMKKKLLMIKYNSNQITKKIKKNKRVISLIKDFHQLHKKCSNLYNNNLFKKAIILFLNKKQSSNSKNQIKKILNYQNQRRKMEKIMIICRSGCNCLISYSNLKTKEYCNLNKFNSLINYANNTIIIPITLIINQIKLKNNLRVYFLHHKSRNIHKTKRIKRKAKLMRMRRRRKKNKRNQIINLHFKNRAG